MADGITMKTGYLCNTEHHLWQAEHLPVDQPHLQFQVRFQFSHIKSTGQGLAKGTFSKCTFPSLLMISGYWVNTHSAQKSIKGCVRYMLKTKRMLQSFLELKPGTWHHCSQDAWNKLPVSCELLSISVGLLSPSTPSCAIIAVKRSGVPFCCCCQTLGKAKRCLPRRTNERKHDYTEQTLKVQSASKGWLLRML